MRVAPRTSQDVGRHGSKINQQSFLEMVFTGRKEIEPCIVDKSVQACKSCSLRLLV